MKKLITLVLAAVMLTACGGKDVADMYTIKDEQPAHQETMNVTVETDEQYAEKDLSKIIKDISNYQYDQTKVNGLRLNFLNKGTVYADAKIAFNDTGIKATGAKKKKEAEINIK